MKEPVTPNDDPLFSYIRDVRQEIEVLLDRAAAANRLVYLFNLLNGWKPGTSRTSSYYTEHVQRWVWNLIHRRIERKENIPFNDVLFAFQLTVESYGFYATLRNFVYAIIGEYADPEPWCRDEIVQGGTSTSRLLRNLSDELRLANAKRVATEFRQTHVEDGLPIRNAIAHGTIVHPSEDNGHCWLLGNYKMPPHGTVEIHEERLSEEDFLNRCRRLFAFRRACDEAFQAHINRSVENERSFECANQSRPKEVLKCSVTDGDVKVRFHGTPFWGNVGRFIRYFEELGYCVAHDASSLTVTCPKSGDVFSARCGEERDLSRLAGEFAAKLGNDLRVPIRKLQRSSASERT